MMSELNDLAPKLFNFRDREDAILPLQGANFVWQQGKNGTGGQSGMHLNGMAAAEEA